MNNKKLHYLQNGIVVIKVFITGLAVFLYIHYFRHQSWPYFTTDPRQPLINIYAIHNGTLSNEPAIKNNMSYGMGISRKGRILHNELANIITTNKNLAWKKLNKDSLLYIAESSKDVGLIRYDDLIIGKGRFLLIKTERASFQTMQAKKNFIPDEYYALTDIR